MDAARDQLNPDAVTDSEDKELAQDIGEDRAVYTPLDVASYSSWQTAVRMAEEREVSSLAVPHTACTA
jgi:hypothetical protein